MQDKPRALVALSEDRQWLVVLDPEPHEDENQWAVYIWHELEFLVHDWAGADTGQDAHAVLEQFLKEASHA